MKRVTWALPILAAALLLAGLLAGPASAAPVASASACKPATNIEAIIDDSGSMAVTDAGLLRVQALNLLIDTLDPGTNLGAVEFGGAFFGEEPAADTLFPPEPVGANAAAMRAALKEKIKADNGGTDYNAAFKQADADNPGAQARIFLTDGGHDIGEYENGHLAHNVPTYVIGFGAGLSGPEDKARLEKIAADTGGAFYPLTDNSQLQSVMNSIGAAITCQTPPRSFVDKLAQGQSKLHGVTIGANTRKLQIALTWASPGDAFRISGLKLVAGKRVLAIAARPKPHKPAKLQVTRTASSTFVVLKVSHLRRGRLVFRVKAAKVGSGEPKATLTTQVGQISAR